MPKFGKQSLQVLATCDDRIQRVLNQVVQYFDCTVIQGHRGKEEQDRYFREGRSKVKFPDGKHNVMPSRAVDVAPYPIDWQDRERFHYFAGFVLAVGLALGVRLRWGGDWDRDFEVDDNRFDDLPHFELAREED